MKAGAIKRSSLAPNSAPKNVSAASASAYLRSLKNLAVSAAITTGTRLNGR
jgi:hypothetical protein